MQLYDEELPLYSVEQNKQKRQPQVSIDEQAAQGDDVDPSSAEQEDDDGNSYFASMLKKTNRSNTISTVQQDISSILVNIDTLQKQCHQVEVLTEVRKHLSSALLTVKASRVECVHDIPIRKRCSPNANNEKQRRFHATRRKRLRTQQGCAKPTRKELLSSKNTLTEADVLVCGVCFKEDDTAGGDTVDWLECETCGMWAHRGCISCSDNNFYCKNCTL